ncbi:hypothetical protein L873DRAFT_1812990 [Choiromyces venosus 120613-1]|uniref:Uncharacterized protein n=1 Tax=Choiromyces venosus 120613-1 TaxID=1336337 RepID=A0A3N4JAR4_9PEZI|nr:hypothetical protein L873DRAFT_1812990 [Choiromyces venosus 120613-1]
MTDPEQSTPQPPPDAPPQPGSQRGRSNSDTSPEVYRQQQSSHQDTTNPLPRPSPQQSTPPPRGTGLFSHPMGPERPTRRMPFSYIEPIETTFVYSASSNSDPADPQDSHSGKPVSDKTRKYCLRLCIQGILLWYIAPYSASFVISWSLAEERLKYYATHRLTSCLRLAIVVWILYSFWTTRKNRLRALLSPLCATAISVFDLIAEED